MSTAHECALGRDVLGDPLAHGQCLGHPVCLSHRLRLLRKLELLDQPSQDVRVELFLQQLVRLVGSIQLGLCGVRPELVDHVDRVELHQQLSVFHRHLVGEPALQGALPTLSLQLLAHLIQQGRIGNHSSGGDVDDLFTGRNQQRGPEAHDLRQFSDRIGGLLASRVKGEAAGTAGSVVDHRSAHEPLDRLLARSTLQERSMDRLLVPRMRGQDRGHGVHVQQVLDRRLHQEPLSDRVVGGVLVHRGGDDALQIRTVRRVPPPVHQPTQVQAIPDHLGACVVHQHEALVQRRGIHRDVGDVHGGRPVHLALIRRAERLTGVEHAVCAVDCNERGGLTLVRPVTGVAGDRTRNRRDHRRRAQRRPEALHEGQPRLDRTELQLVSRIRAIQQRVDLVDGHVIQAIHLLSAGQVLREAIHRFLLELPDRLAQRRGREGGAHRTVDRGWVNLREVTIPRRVRCFVATEVLIDERDELVHRSGVPELLHEPHHVQLRGLHCQPVHQQVHPITHVVGVTPLDDVAFLVRDRRAELVPPSHQRLPEQHHLRLFRAHGEDVVDPVRHVHRSATCRGDRREDHILQDREVLLVCTRERGHQVAPRLTARHVERAVLRRCRLQSGDRLPEVSTGPVGG